MAVVADTGALYALYDADDRHHAAVRRFVEKLREPIIIPVVILAEVDYLLAEHLGVEAELDFLEAIRDGFFLLEPFHTADVARCKELIEQYADLRLGLADSAVVATAERLGIHRILTLDERHFRPIKPRRGPPFTLLPGG